MPPYLKELDWNHLGTNLARLTETTEQVKQQYRAMVAQIHRYEQYHRIDQTQMQRTWQRTWAASNHRHWQVEENLNYTAQYTVQLANKVKEKAPYGPAKRTLLIASNRKRAAAIRKRIAIRRAEQTLLSILDEQQRREWQRGHFFHVHMAGGLRVYRISKGLAGNVKVVKCDVQPAAKRIAVGAALCMHVYHPDGWVPDEDNCLAQKLLIETDEDAFLREANVSNMPRMREVNEALDAALAALDALDRSEPTPDDREAMNQLLVAA